MTSSITARAAGPRAKFGLLVLSSLGGLMAAGAASAVVAMAPVVASTTEIGTPPTRLTAYL